jgi:hypothetical protein
VPSQHVVMHKVFPVSCCGPPGIAGIKVATSIMTAA